METSNRDGGIDSGVLRNIGFNARRLARTKAVPGMVVEDYEQDLLLDLLHRRRAFDRDRASLATFADRVVRHRVSTLTSPTLRMRAERKVISLDSPELDEDGYEQALIDLLPDEEAPPVDDTVVARIDVRRFIETLPAPLFDCCEVLLADSIVDGARGAGIHRSTVYARAEKLRERAAANGLDIYFVRSSDSFDPAPVNGPEGVTYETIPGAGAETIVMSHPTKPPRVQLLLTEADLRAWLLGAKGGETLEYHRGVLAIDRVRIGGRLPEDDCRELDRVARAAMAIAEASQGYLLQRRHGSGDYSYLVVVREKSPRSSDGLIMLKESTS